MPKPTWINTCESCAWFDDSDLAEDTEGICRLGSFYATFPYRLKTEWCSRYQNIDDVNKWCLEDEENA